MKRLPRMGWRDLAPDEAADLGFEQVGRWTWQLFEIEWLGRGIAIWARAKL